MASRVTHCGRKQSQDFLLWKFNHKLQKGTCSGQPFKDKTAQGIRIQNNHKKEQHECVIVTVNKTGSSG